MAGLGFAQAGDFLPYLSYNAKAGKFFLNKDKLETEVVNPTFVPDFEKIKTGWMYFAKGSAPQYVWHPSLSVKTPRPEGVDKEGKPNFKEGFKVLLYSQDTFGGVAEFSSSAIIVRNALDKVFVEWEEGRASNPGKSPVITTNGTTKIKTEYGDNYAPNFAITKWIDTPKEFSSPSAANQPPSAPVAAKSVSEF